MQCDGCGGGGGCESQVKKHRAVWFVVAVSERCVQETMESEERTGTMQPEMGISGLKERQRRDAVGEEGRIKRRDAKEREGFPLS